MSEHFEAMPDYLAALELELRARALSMGAESTRTEIRRRLTIGWHGPVLASALAALCLVLMLVISGTTGKDTRAYGRPAILAARPTTIPSSLQHGFLLEKRAGRGVNLVRARPFTTPAGTGYLLDGDGVWCLSVPDPDARHPQVERAVDCTRTREFLRIGIQVVARKLFVAVIPSGVRDPTVIHPNGTMRSLQPNRRGVVVDAAPAPGDTFVLYGINGQRETSHAR